jgi:hypothetical protein
MEPLVSEVFFPNNFKREYYINDWLIMLWLDLDLQNKTC